MVTWLKKIKLEAKIKKMECSADVNPLYFKGHAIAFCDQLDGGRHEIENALLYQPLGRGDSPPTIYGTYFVRGTGFRVKLLTFYCPSCAG